MTENCEEETECDASLRLRPAVIASKRTHYYNTMKRASLCAIFALGMFLSSCMSERRGIFGCLPEIYEQTASQQRDLEALLASGSADDQEAAQAMHSFMQSVKSLENNVTRESKSLLGRKVSVVASPASGLKVNGGEIAAVSPGTVTTVEIRVPMDKAPVGSTAYFCFLDDDGEPVAKARGWYDAKARAVRLQVPFAISTDGVTVPEGAFDHYDLTQRLALVSESEYRKDSYVPTEQTIKQPTTVDSGMAQPDTILLDDSAILTIEPDSLPGEAAEPEPQWVGPVLNSNGVGEVRLGASLKGLPDHIHGLYDRKKLETEIDEMEEEALLTATFYLGKQRVMTALGDEQGNIVFLTVEAPTIKIDVDGHFFAVGDRLAPLYELHGVAIDETGAFACTYRGISVSPTPTGRIHSISIGAVW